MSVNIALMIGVINDTKSSAACRTAASGWRMATSCSTAVSTPSARQPSMFARMVSSIRRTSGWTMIGSAGLSGCLAPFNARPCTRSFA